LRNQPNGQIKLTDSLHISDLGFRLDRDLFDKNKKINLIRRQQLPWNFFSDNCNYHVSFWLLFFLSENPQTKFKKIKIDEINISSLIFCEYLLDVNLNLINFFLLCFGPY
jgi:hypothetical protein